MQKLNIALVGVGFGGCFAGIYKNHPNVGKIGIFDTNYEAAKNCADFHNIEHIYSSFEEILSDKEIDAVHLVTPIPLHAEQTIQVLNAGKHCACTVPMATSLEDIKRITDAVRKSGKNYMMMETTLYTYQFFYVSDMKKKDEVLAIIDTPDIPDERRKLWIERLDRGWTWKYMLDNIYPHLRCARFLAVYFDSTDGGATDIINAANGMIRKGEYHKAYEHLQPVSDDMRAFNSIGVALMMQGKFEEAMPWLEKALEGNCQDAQKNIDTIKAEWEYEALQRKEIEEYLNRYN